MTARIKFSPDGVYVSQPGYDVNAASLANMNMYPGMTTMFPATVNTVTLAAGGAADFAVSNPTGRIPFVILSATSGEVPARNAYCAEVSPPYTSVRIRNISGPTRTIKFAVLVDNT